jgi:phage/plasmid-like protein (TIGR03299 family)
MAHNIDMTNGRANMAFVGSRADIWHKLGNEMKPGQSIEEWSKAAGIDWRAIMVPAFRDLSGPDFVHLATSGLVLTDNVKHCVRSDNGAALGVATDGYVAHQPRELLELLYRYIGTDSRFQMDVAGSLKGGKIIWATATYKDGMTVGGDAHVMRLLMTTTFDGSGATIGKATATRVVCNNTLNAALADSRATIRIKHNTTFNADRAAKDLSNIARGFDEYAAMGDAMAAIETSKADISNMFKAVLDIPFDAKQDDLSTRKQNQFAALQDAYRKTIAEGTPAGSAWSALNAVTRYVDHDRATRGAGDSETEARFISAQFGSGAQMKEKAVAFLYKTATDRATKGDSDADLAALLKATPFRPTVIAA